MNRAFKKKWEFWFRFLKLFSLTKKSFNLQVLFIEHEISCSLFTNADLGQHIAMRLV